MMTKRIIIVKDATNAEDVMIAIVMTTAGAKEMKMEI